MNLISCHGIQLYLISACGTLNIGLKPPSQAIQVEYVAAFQLLGLFDLLQANDACVVNALELVFLGIHIGQALEFVYELARLNEKLYGLAQADKGVNNLTEEVDWELLPRENVGEELDIQKQGNGIKHKGHDVEHEALLSPLLSVVQLYQADRVLKVVLDGLQEESHELKTRVKCGQAYLEPNENEDLIDLLSGDLEPLIECVSHTEVYHNQQRIEDHEPEVLLHTPTPSRYEVVTALVGQPVNDPEEEEDSQGQQLVEVEC